MNDRFLQTQKLYQVVDFESYLVLVVLGICAYLFYKFLLKDVNQERHSNIQNHLKVLFKYDLTLTFFYIIYRTFSYADFPTASSVLPYIALITFGIGAVCFVKTCHLLVLQYLFLGSMRAGVPLLIVNIFSIVLSVVIAFWSVNHLFGVQLTPLLATSAAFSIILGLALQDTLGNLFAGISLQIDHSFEIGNWVEIMNGSNKIVGQVRELSWRSTMLAGFSDELIILPNKLVASSQISNFSPESGPILRSQLFKFPHNAPIEKTLETLALAATQLSEVRAHPAPLAFVLETTESFIAVKLIYFIDNYGQQFLIGDKVISNSLTLLKKNEISLAQPILNVASAVKI